MQTRLTDSFRTTPEGQEAEAILRSCVHCGFCNATCPTYQLLGDELDGPRGRIYLIKQMLEDQPVTALTRTHLDRCLTCRNCETTCPSGVQYGRLIDIGRVCLEQRAPRPLPERLLREGLRRGLNSPALFAPLLKAGQVVRDWLPDPLRAHVPPRSASAQEARVGTTGRAQADTPQRTMLVLAGCVQPNLTPETNAAATRVLERLGIRLISAPGAGCCGALDQHLAAVEDARQAMRRNIDAWWPDIERGAEAIVMTASGCGSVVKEYGHHLRHDPRYAEKARRVSALARDLGEVLAGEDLSRLRRGSPRRIAFHPPCSLQHGQQVRGVIERILSGLGHHLVPVTEAHLCCGSAGAYSLLQPELAGQLRDRKLGHLQAAAPELIATANIGCQMHLRQGAHIPVLHWISLLDANESGQE